MSSPNANSDYRARINKVMDYIQDNLDKRLSLDELSAVACFSPFHFHRIFRALVGETVHQFTQRLRIEKAAQYLLVHPGKTITEIALETGMSSSAAFARLFKDFYGISASTFRLQGNNKYSKHGKVNSKIRKTESKMRKGSQSESSYIYSIRTEDGALPEGDYNPSETGSKTIMSIKTDVAVKDIPTMTVAYIRHIGPYKENGALFGKLIATLTRWAGPRGLMSQPDLTLLNIYHDDPEITDEKNLRLSVCLSVPDDTVVDGEIGKMKIEGGKNAVGTFELGEDQFQEAWDFMYGTWLPSNGYQPDDRPCFERCLNDPQKHPEHKHLVEIHVPVKPA